MRVVPALHVDEEFRKLIAPPSEAEYLCLERSLLQEGCRDAIVVWKGKGIILDGHTRYQICRTHGIPFKTVELEFANKDDAKEWIIQNQFARRNITVYTRCLLALQLEGLFAAKARRRQAEGGRRKVTLNSAEAVSKSGETRDAVAKLAGASHDTIAKVKLIREKGTEKEKRELSKPDSRMTINRVYWKLRQRQLQTATPPLPKGKFNLIYCDPPWRYESAEFADKAVENRYPTLSLDELSALSVSSIAADDCTLFVWAPACKLQEAAQLISNWGFRYRTCAVWVKCRLSFGYYFRNEHELLLLGTRGNPRSPLPSRRPSSVITVVRTGHSRKPDLVYELLERMYPASRKIELFATHRRDSWTSWGNQLTVNKGKQKAQRKVSLGMTAGEFGTGQSVPPFK
jgi:N6-adenosine-specific RNA methylase IME4